jgi:hypothetical protein
MISLLYKKLSSKQSLQVEHINYMLLKMKAMFESSYSVKGTKLILEPTVAEKGMKLLLTKIGYDGRLLFIESLFDYACGEFDTAFGAGNQNYSFKKQELENIELLFSKVLGKFGKEAPIPFVVPTGKLNKNEFLVIDNLREDYPKLHWSHIISGVDTYENGYLWGSIQAGVGAASKYLYTSKLDAYKTMLDVMRDSKKIAKSAISMWEEVIEYWEANYDENLTNFK